MDKIKARPTERDYDRIFSEERDRIYPAIDEFIGGDYAIDKTRLENAARILACPFKKNPPNWQHGRIIYSAARAYCEKHSYNRLGGLRFVDIGTAKGFSALMLAFALHDAGQVGRVQSTDVLDPHAVADRNSIADLWDVRTVPALLRLWGPTQAIELYGLTGTDLLRGIRARVHFAVVDGKHTYDVVREEARLLSERQLPGDVVFYDDVQMPGVMEAVKHTPGYDVRWIWAKPERGYALAVKQ